MHSVVGRLRMERRLGSGGFATVWLAHDPELDAPVAVKILADNWADHADVRRRFADEARLLRRVDNDHVVRVYDVGVLDDGRPYLVMTYAEGGTLADRMAGSPPPWPPTAVVELVDALAAGLGTLHEHGIVHRDVNPRNVLFRRAGAATERVLLGDLGIAKDLRFASGLTYPAGTARYQAPEQAVVSSEVGPAADVHALAVTTAELMGLAGPPWPAGPAAEVVRRATAPDPRRRTPTPARFAAELRAAIGPGSAAADPPSRPSDPPLPRQPPDDLVGAPPPSRRGSDRRGAAAPPPRRRRRVLLGLGLAVLTAAAVLAATADRDVRVVSASGKVSVTLPGAWRTSPLLVPGETAGEGVRLASGDRSVGVAFAPVAASPAQVATRGVAAAGCAAVQPYDISAGDLRGVAFVHRRCPGGIELTEAGVADPRRPGWVVRIDIRAVAGTPELEQVLRGLAVEP